MIVRVGRTLLRDLIKGDTTGGITHIGIGEGTAATMDTDTALSSEVFNYSPTDRIPTSGGKHGDGSIKIKGLLNCLQGEESHTEVGLFTSNSSGTMFLRNASFSAEINKTLSRYNRYTIIIDTK